MKKIAHLGVVGAGQMGTGIAMVASMHNLRVSICDN